MNIIELEEGLHNLIATQPQILEGVNAGVIIGIKDIIEAHKAFCFRVEEYPEQDILKVGLMNEYSKLELNLISYICQILQERGINIMLYVPKYAAAYNNEINKYIEKPIIKEKELSLNEEVEDVENIQNIEMNETQDQAVVSEEKYYFVDKNQQENEKDMKKMEGTTRR